MNHTEDVALRDRLYRAASCFRQALAVIAAGHNAYGVFPNGFPGGACGEASKLLAHYLRSEGFGPLRYRWGYFHKPDGGCQSHAWLEHGSFIIDITADQFPEISAPVIVTRDRSWYDRFTSQEDSTPYFDDVAEYMRKRFDRCYAATVALMVMAPPPAH